MRVGDRVRTPLAGLTGRVIHIPPDPDPGQRFVRVHVQFDPGQDGVSILQIARYPADVLAVITEEATDAE